MNALGTALLAAVITAGGVFAYDALKGSPPPSAPSSPLRDASSSEAAAPALETKGAVAPDLGAELERRLAAQDRRIAAMEENVLSIKTDLETFREVWMKAGPRPAPGTESGNPLPRDEPAGFDEEALRLVEQQMEEISRRRRLQLRERTVRSHLDHLDLGLTSGVQEDLLRTILAFQAESDAFWKRVRERNLDPSKEQGAYQRVIDQYRVRVEALVPDETAAAGVARRFLGAGASSGPSRPPVPLPRPGGK